MLEVIGCVPKLHTTLTKNVQWLRDLLSSVKEEVREYASLLYAIYVNNAFTEIEFEKVINFLITQCSSKTLEAQHGAIITIGNCLERKIMTSRDYQQINDLIKKSVNTIG